MNLKKTILALSVLPFFLSACGGGGSGDSYESSPSTQFRNGDQLYSIYYNSNDRFGLNYIEFQNGQFTYTDSFKPLNSVIVTRNRIYQTYDQAQNTLSVNSPSHWTMNIIGDIQTDIEMERVNLSGKNVFDTVLPGYRNIDRNDLNPNVRLFIAKDGLKNFSSGSYCYRKKAEQNRVDYLQLYPNTSEPLEESFNQFYEDNLLYLDLLNDKNPIVKFQLAKDRWMGMNFSSIFDTSMKISLDDSTAIEFESKLYPAEYHQTLKRTTDDEYKLYEKLLMNDDVAENRQRYQLLMANIEKGCTYYNKTAAESFITIPGLR